MHRLGIPALPVDTLFVASCVENFVKALAFIDCFIHKLASEDILVVSARSQKCKDPFIAETPPGIGHFHFTVGLHLFHLVYFPK
jgi:hypothetical protein